MIGNDPVALWRELDDLVGPDGSLSSDLLKTGYRVTVKKPGADGLRVTLRLVRPTFDEACAAMISVLRGEVTADA